MDLGPAFAHDLSVVNLDGSAISDDRMSSLSEITSLRRLYLNRNADHRQRNDSPAWLVATRNP